MNAMSYLKQLADRSQHAANTVETGPIGIEFAIGQMYLMQLQREPDGGLSLLANTAYSYPCKRDEFLASPLLVKGAIRQALKSAPFRGRRVVTCLPPNDIRLISVAYAVEQGRADEGRELLKALSGRVNGELSDYVIDYLPIRAHESNSEHLALVAVAEQKRVYDFLDTLRYAGMEVEALDIAPAAIKRLITAISIANHEENILAINFGESRSYITLISGNHLLFDHEIEFGESCLLSWIASSLDMDIAQAREMVRRYGLLPQSSAQRDGVLEDMDIASTLVEIIKPKFNKLVDEVNRALIYAASETRGKPVNHVYLLGSIARWPGADAVLNKLINIPVSLPDFPSHFDEFFIDENSMELLPEMAVATGLALRGMKELD